MALGKRGGEQQELWVATTELPRSPGHPFYRRLNGLLAEAGFDAWLETLCAPYYSQGTGRPSIPPGVYFRMILVGYFEGIASQRGIAWRCSDSLSLREFLGVPPTEASPDHSSLTRVHQRLPQSVHEAVFGFVLGIAARKKLLSGRSVAVDSTMLEANAAMKSIVRKDTGEDWQEYLTRLMREAGEIDESATPTDEELRRFDQRRRDKKVSNAEWESSTDADSRIARMKDGRTHLAYKAEHVVDLNTDLLLAATIYPADRGDTETLAESVVEAQKHLMRAESGAVVEEVAADKGYHADETLDTATNTLGMRTYIAEPKRKYRRRWTNKPAEFRRAVTDNRRRLRRDKGRRLQRRRSELCERSFAHVCETGGARRCWLRGVGEVAKRYLLQAAARNLGLILRKLFHLGTPRGLQGAGAATSLAHFAHFIRWTSLIATTTYLYGTRRAPTAFHRPHLAACQAA